MVLSSRTPITPAKFKKDIITDIAPIDKLFEGDNDHI
jgi:hypothetical protein